MSKAWVFIAVDMQLRETLAVSLQNPQQHGGDNVTRLQMSERVCSMCNLS